MEHETRDELRDSEDLEGGREPEARFSTEEESLEDVRAQRDEYLSLLRRAQADYKNLRRRGQSDLEAGVRRGLEPLLDSLMLVLDHLDMALSTPTISEDAKNLARGVQMTRDQLLGALEREEVREVDSTGAFDADRHQAVATVETLDVPAGNIVDTIRKGYSWRDAVLRPAQVRVATNPKDARSTRGAASDRD